MVSRRLDSAASNARNHRPLAASLPDTCGGGGGCLVETTGVVWVVDTALVPCFGIVVAATAAGDGCFHKLKSMSLRNVLGVVVCIFVLCFVNR